MMLRLAKEGTRKPPKRMVAAGKKINGTWQVKTFLPAANAPREPFWQTPTRGR